MERPDAFEYNSPEYMGFITSFLNCTIEEIDTEFDLFEDSEEYDPEEMYLIPSEFETLIEIDHLHSPTFSWGYVVFGIYKGTRVVIEQNASPLAIYFKRRIGLL